MRSKFGTALIAAVVAALVLGLAGIAIADNDPAATRIKSTRLDDVNPLTGKGFYSGKLKSKDPDCIKGRKVKVIHLSTPPFTIGETETDEDGLWELEGNVPPSGTPQKIKIVVSKTKDCDGATRRYDIDDID